MSGFDPVHIVDVLARHRVEFVIIGGFAAELYEAPVPATQDIDVTPRVSQPNMARLSAALDELGAQVYTTGVPDGLPFAHDAASLAQVKVWNLICAAGRLDITFRPDGTGGYDDLAGHAVGVDVAGYDVDVAALEDIIRSKTAAGRAKDLSVLPALERWLDVLWAMSADELRSSMAKAVERRRGLPRSR